MRTLKFNKVILFYVGYFIQNKQKLLFYGLWLCLGAWQAYVTQLSSDEAYYWTYSKALDWGYFDHPPMAALWIKIGYSIFQNEFGVRLLFITAFVGSILLLEFLIKPKSSWLFHICFLLFPIFHFFSFLALPDTVLFFFTCCFLFVYKKFIALKSWKYVFLIGLAVAGMLLSKYHSFLFLLLFFLPQYKSLISKKIFVAFLFAAILCLPHLIWQIKNDFVSVHYHFSGRNESYKIAYTLEYLANQFVFLLPFIPIIFLIQFIKTKCKNAYEKGLYSVFVGFFIFFFIMSFKGRVEPHWTYLAFIPLFYFGYKSFEQRRMVLRPIVFIISVILISLARLSIAYKILPDNILTIHFYDHYHRARQEAKCLDRIAKNKDIAFMNSYQKAALYDFYGNAHSVISINNIMGRRNQYDLWQSDTNLMGKEVLIVPNYSSSVHQRLSCGNDEIEYFNQYSFLHYASLQFEVKQISKSKWVLHLDKMPNKYLAYLNKRQPSLHYFLFKEQKKIASKNIRELKLVDLNTKINIELEYPYVPKGAYQLYFCLSVDGLPPSINSNAIQLKL